MRSLRRFSPNVHTVITGVLAIVLTLLLVACAGCDAQRLDGQVAIHTAAGPLVVATTSTTMLEHRVVARASRTENLGTRKPVAPRAVPVTAPLDAAFWRRLANCESSDGRSGTFLGYFQFSHDTAGKVGWYAPKPTPPADRQWTYDEQAGMAQRWLGMIGGRGGSRAGWPVCWWRALRS